MGATTNVSFFNDIPQMKWFGLLCRMNELCVQLVKDQETGPGSSMVNTYPGQAQQMARTSVN